MQDDFIRQLDDSDGSARRRLAEHAELETRLTTAGNASTFAPPNIYRISGSRRPWPVDLLSQRFPSLRHRRPHTIDVTHIGVEHRPDGHLRDDHVGDGRRSAARQPPAPGPESDQCRLRDLLVVVSGVGAATGHSCRWRLGKSARRIP